MHDRQHLSTLTELYHRDSHHKNRPAEKGGTHLLWGGTFVPWSSASPLLFNDPSQGGYSIPTGGYLKGGQGLLYSASQENLKQWLPTKSFNNDKIRRSIVWLKYENAGEGGFPPSLAQAVIHLNIDNTFHWDSKQEQGFTAWWLRRIEWKSLIT